MSLLSLVCYIGIGQLLIAAAAVPGLGLEQVGTPRRASLVRLRVRRRLGREALGAHRPEQNLPRLRLGLGIDSRGAKPSRRLRRGPAFDPCARRTRPVFPSPFLARIRQTPGVRVVALEELTGRTANRACKQNKTVNLIAYTEIKIKIKLTGVAVLLGEYVRDEPVVHVPLDS